MDLFKAFHTDKRAEKEGRELVLVQPKAAEGTSPAVAKTALLIARKGNANYKAYLSRVLQENRAMLDTKTPEAEVLAQGIFRDAAARHLLIGWTGVEYKGAKNVPYSVEAARELLEMDDFNTLVDNFASDMSNYRDEEVAKDAKNSAST